MSHSARAAPITISRLQAFSSWLQAGGTTVPRVVKSWREEGEALASLLQKEGIMFINANCNLYDAISPDRLRAVLLLLTTCILSLDAAAKLSYNTLIKMQFSTMLWMVGFINVKPHLSSRTQLAVAEVLLRAKVLQGCSRQLASTASAVAAATQRTERSRLAPRLDEGTERASELKGAIGNATLLLRGLASKCEIAQVMEEQGTASAIPGCRANDRQTAAVAVEGQGVEAKEKEQGEDGLRGQEAGSGVGHLAGCRQLLVAALYDSSVLEHMARGMLVQAGWLQRMRQAGRQQSQAYGQLYLRLSASSSDFAWLYRVLVCMHGGPAVPGASNPTASREVGDGAPAQTRGAPPTPHHQQHASTPTPPLAASGHGLDTAHMSLLHRVLSGPCARHLVLCQGLRALCALDGGGDYGLPEDAGLQGLPLGIEGDEEEEEEGEPSQHVLMDLDPLCNLVDMLVMRPHGDQGPKVEAQPPGRGARLQLTLRVAHAAVGGAKPEAGGGGVGGSQGSPRYTLDQTEAATTAVKALDRAWQHVPPSRGRARLDRRRAALRRWAAAAEQVARSGVVTGAGSHPLCGRNLACMLRLHPSYVGRLERQDMPSLASGGHLLRALEGLVSQVARAVADQAGGNQSAPAGGAQLRTPTGWALRFFLIEEQSCGIWPCPLRDLLLQPGEDEQPGEGQGAGGAGQEQGRAREAAGHSGGGGLRAAASLAVALGKLLRRCEGAVLESLAKCGGSEADGDFDDETGRDTALEIMWAVCGVLLASPVGAVSGGARTGAGAGAGEEGAAPAPEGGAQLGCGWEARRRLAVCSYGAWRWLPALASMARRAAAEGHINSASLQAWLACLVWVGRLCLACCKEARMAGPGLEASEGHGGNEESGTAAAKSGGPQPSRGAAGGDGSGGGCRGCGAQDGCWREFLLQDVGVVGLLGAALSGVVPELLARVGEEGSRGLLKAVAEACVLAAATFPTEVAQYAWGAQGGAADSSGGGSSGAGSSRASRSAVWSPKVLAEMAGVVGEEPEGQPLAGALRALEQWGGACEMGGGPVEPSTEERQLLERVVADMFDDAEVQDWRHLLPPLFELRALLRVCSNPRCVALPPPEETEAEAEAGGGRGPSCGDWYCCATCRKQHGRAGQGAGAAGVKLPPRDEQVSGVLC